VKSRITETSSRDEVFSFSARDVSLAQSGYSYTKLGSVPLMFLAAAMLHSSAIRLLYPASLSYHAYIFTMVPSITCVLRASTIQLRVSLV
jgi:hypothetical protein